MIHINICSISSALKVLAPTNFGNSSLRRNSDEIQFPAPPTKFNFPPEIPTKFNSVLAPTKFNFPASPPRASHRPAASPRMLRYNKDLLGDVPALTRRHRELVIIIYQCVSVSSWFLGCSCEWDHIPLYDASNVKNTNQGFIAITRTFPDKMSDVVICMREQRARTPPILRGCRSFMMRSCGTP